MPPENDIDLFALSAFKIIRDYFDIILYRADGGRVMFRANPILRKKGWERELNKRLKTINARIKIVRDKDAYNITVYSTPFKIGKPPLVNILLFILTLLTVLIISAYREVGPAVFSSPELLLVGLPFTITLMIILLVHEMGHFWAGYRRGVLMSYPFFIPAPTFIGTFGAIIKGRSPIRTKNDLIFIGAAGPLAGAIPSIIAVIWGQMSSQVAPLSADVTYLSFGSSIFTYVISHILYGNLPQGMGIFLSPIALAGQVGLLITMINLLPLGQLDGGHIFYGLFGKKQRFLAVVFMLFLLIIGYFWKGWWLWLFLAFIMRPFHPPVIEDAIPPDRKHKIIAWIAIILFILTFVPRPIYYAG
ncbi:MAG: site-2 protease family protein [candidate division Zixibacteria bacterium]